MSVDRREVDLIIRAQLQKGNTLEAVTKSIADLEKALEAQADAAKRGEVSLDSLKATLESLKRAQDQLKDQAGIIGQFQRLTAQIEKSAERAAKSVKTYEEYKAKLDQVGDASENQSRKLIRLGEAVERNQQRLSRQRADQEALATSLREAGIATDQLAASEDRVRQSAAQLGISINKVNKSIESYTDDVRAAREAEARLANERVFQQKIEEAARLNKAGEYVRFWTDALRNAEVVEEQIRVNTALRKTADEAVAAARGYKTLGTAAKSLVSGSSGLRNTIASILDPATQARTSLAGVEDEIRKVNAAVSSIKGPVENYRQQVQQLVSVQKALTSQASLVDSFIRQTEAVRQARAEFTQARAQVLQYAAAMRSGGQQNDQLAASLRNAQAALATAQKNLLNQIVAARGVRDSMRQAGLATNDLAGVQRRLTSAAQTSTNALRNLEVAQRRYGESVRASGAAQDFFTSSGRTTLSLAQRIRGEILAMAAAYIGLYGAINGASRAIDAYNLKQGILNQLALSVGDDSRRVAEEYEYVRQQADRIGISFESAAKGYAKFSAAAALAGRDSQEIRYIFEAFSEVGRVANLSKDDLDGVFKALEQIISKGTIQAEELRGQLGDRLFGAFQVAAQALKDQFPQLDKAMKNGQVTADQLLKIAEKYREMVGPRLSQATQNLSANQARLNSALFDFKVLVAESGFADEFAKLVDTLSRFFQSSDGKKFAQDLSDGLSLVVQALRLIIENIETVKIVLTTVFGLYGAKIVLGLGASALDTADKFKKLSQAMAATSGVRNVLMKGFLALNAFWVGWNIGKILSEKFLEVRLFGIALVVGLESLWTRLKFSTKIIFAELPNIIMDALATAGNGLTKFTRTILGAFSAAARGLGKNDLADSIDRAIKAIEFRTGRIGNASGKLAAEMEAELKKIREIGDAMAADAMNPVQAAQKRNPTSPTAKPSVTGGGTNGRADEKELERRKRLKEQIEAELVAIDSKIEKQEKDSLDSRLKAIDSTYFKLIRKIRSLGGAESEAFARELENKIGQLKAQETKKFNDALLKEQTDLQKKLEQIDATAGRNAKTDLDRRLAAVKLQHESTYREIDEFRRRLIADGRDTTPADLLKQRLDAGVIAIQNLERQKFYEDAINEALSERKSRLDIIAINQRAGAITSLQAQEQINKVITETQPRIDQISEAGIRFAEQMREAAKAAGESTGPWDRLIARLMEAKNAANEYNESAKIAAQVSESFANNTVNLFSEVADAVGKAAAGMGTWKDAIDATRRAFLNFAADFLREIAVMIAKRAILSALEGQKGKGGIFGTIADVILSAGVKHRGGLVGATGGSSRLVSAAMFANAPRYHGGGIPGLAPDEYPTILKKNEEVLSASSPRNVLNGGAAAGQQQASVGLKVINMIDSGSVVSEGLSTQDGERAFFNFIRANRTGIKQALG